MGFSYLALCASIAAARASFAVMTPRLDSGAGCAFSFCSERRAVDLLRSLGVPGFSRMGRLPTPQRRGWSLSRIDLVIVPRHTLSDWTAKYLPNGGHSDHFPVRAVYRCQSVPPKGSEDRPWSPGFVRIRKATDKERRKAALQCELETPIVRRLIPLPPPCVRH